MLRVSKETEMTPTIIEYLIKQFRMNDLSRLQNLEGYYQGNNVILQRVMIDITKPNNKTPNPYANYITDMYTGYFAGKPITYSGKDDAILEELNLIFAYNDEADENSEIAKDASIYGKAYEMLYVDSNSATRFKKVNPKEVICVYDDTIEGDMLFAIRFYSGSDIMGENAYSIAEVYSNFEVATYKGNEDFTGFILQETHMHYFALVPFIEYKNNDDVIGDYELVVPLIDAYDKLGSDSLNDFEYFTDSYLGLIGMDFPTDAEGKLDTTVIQSMKENRLLLIPEGGSAGFITKQVNDAQIENLKTRIDNDIHKFSKCPALTDKDFAGTSSGVAMKYKLIGFENVASVKERKFKKGLQRRIELISNIMTLTSSTFDYRSIELTFIRNIPNNITEVADTINKLRGLVSDETLIAQLPFITDIQAEIDKLAEETPVVGGVTNEQQGILETSLAPSVNESIPQ